MILLFLIQILLGLNDGEKIVFSNDSNFNVYAVQIYQSNIMVLQDTLFPNQKSEYLVEIDTPYRINWDRITKFGEYHRFPADYGEQSKSQNTITLKSNKMVTIHLAPQDIP